MPVENSDVQLRGDTVLSEERDSVYGALFNKINLNPDAEWGGIDAFQNSEALSDVPADERVTPVVSVLLKLFKQSPQKVERLDKVLLDDHMAALDMQISRQLERRAAQQRTQGVRLGYCDDEGISLHFSDGPNTVHSVAEEA